MSMQTWLPPLATALVSFFTGLVTYATSRRQGRPLAANGNGYNKLLAKMIDRLVVVQEENEQLRLYTSHLEYQRSDLETRLAECRSSRTRRPRRQEVSAHVAHLTPQPQPAYSSASGDPQTEAAGSTSSASEPGAVAVAVGVHVVADEHPDPRPRDAGGGSDGGTDSTPSAA